MFAKFRLDLLKFGRFFPKISRKYAIEKKLGLSRGHSFIRGVKTGPYSVAHPQYLLSPEYPRAVNAKKPKESVHEKNIFIDKVGFAAVWIRL